MEEKIIYTQEWLLKKIFEAHEQETKEYLTIEKEKFYMLLLKFIKFIEQN